MSTTKTRRAHIHPSPQTQFFISNGIPFIPPPQNEPYASIHDPNCSYGGHRGYRRSSSSSSSSRSCSSNSNSNSSSSTSRNPTSADAVIPNSCTSRNPNNADADLRFTHSPKSEPPNFPSQFYPSVLWSGSILIAALVLVLPLALPTALPPPPSELLFLPLAILCLLLFQAITAGSGGNAAANSLFIDPAAHGSGSAPVAAAICSGQLGGQFVRTLTPPKDRSIPH